MKSISKIQSNLIFKNIRVIIFACLYILIMSPIGWAATYYVDSSVVSSGDGSAVKPWKNISNISGLRAGDSILFKKGKLWNEQLSATSGAIDNPITYSVYGTGEKPVITNFLADGNSYIHVENIEFKSNGSKYPVLVTNKSHHIKFLNVGMHAESACTPYAAARIYNESHHIELDGCDIYHKNSGSKDGLSLKHGANHCLIRNCTIGTAGHSGFAIVGADDAAYSYQTNYNIIYNNIIHNPRDRALEIQYNANWNVIANNVIRGCDDGSCSADGNTRSFKLITHNNIVRHNLILDNKSSLSSTAGLSLRPYQYGTVPIDKTLYNHIYNNVITGISNEPWVLDDADPTAGCEIKWNYFKNNISYSNGINAQLVIANDSSISDNYFFNNLFFKSGVSSVLKIKGSTYTVESIKAADPAHWGDNLNANPNLDANYRPNAGSPVIDAGAFLTEVTSSSGSGKTFSVKDAGYFTDGLGIIQGDTIRVGASTAIIGSIDYNNNTITLLTSISWNKSDPVSLTYNGVRPDIGAFESSAPSVLIPPANLKIMP